MISFVTTPTNVWLEQSLATCRKRFLLACPYVGDYLVNVARRLPKTVSRVLVTRTDLRDFAKGASDLGAVCDNARLGASVLSLPRLHAKVYVIDSCSALVTSANATHIGMRRNWECGIAITDQTEICRLADMVLSGFGAKEKPVGWSLSELEKLREPVRILRESLPPAVPSVSTGLEEHPRITLSGNRWLRFSAGLPDWTRLTLGGVIAQPQDQFDIRDIYRTCLPLVAKQFPANKFPREKLRQQLQRLRDLGIVEFLGGGSYRRTIKARD